MPRCRFGLEQVLSPDCLAVCSFCMIMLLRAALRRNRPYRPIGSVTVFQPSAADQVVALAECFRALARAAWRWLPRLSNNCATKAGSRQLCLCVGSFNTSASTTPFCRRRPTVQRRRIPESVAFAQVAGASMARALPDMQR